MLRAEVALGSDLGLRAKAIMDQGGLVPDEVMLDMVVKRLAKADASRGWILDGFPRTIPQAEALEQRLGERGIDLVVTLDIDREEIVERVSGRRICEEGHVYHVRAHTPRVPGVCDIDGSKLRQREDDSEQVVNARLDLYERETKPLLDHYRRADLLIVVEGRGSPEDVAARVEKAFRDS